MGPLLVPRFGLARTRGKAITYPVTLVSTFRITRNRAAFDETLIRPPAEFRSRLRELRTPSTKVHRGDSSMHQLAMESYVVPAPKRTILDPAFDKKRASKGVSSPLARSSTHAHLSLSTRTDLSKRPTIAPKSGL